ncbi:uncharacterized protein LOC111344276 isoform X3 [Stylophora pistillata]|uniref:uncharacterized protein LOC111344276 isoform X3 n=1 Tax=Stylophora pistillata TaxID=50429 RepID=UPI000C03A399|nr:uncharacterized protein LOC111344276 isoform X3 [Stylophora pistillata]
MRLRNRNRLTRESLTTTISDLLVLRSQTGKCRMNLFSSAQLASHKDQREEDGPGTGQKDLFSHEKCSSWFLEDEEMLPWVHDSVEEAQWTEGKLYCPKCKSRIGAFDFIHGIHCNCGKFIIPAVWIQKSRVDLIFPTSQITNLDIRNPTVLLPFDQSTRNSFDKNEEPQQNKAKSCVGNISQFDYTDPRANTDITQIESSSGFSVDTNGRLVDSEGKDIKHCDDKETPTSHSTSNVTMENIPKSLRILACECVISESDVATCSVQQDICSNAFHQAELCPIHNCQQCCSIRLHGNHSGSTEAETSSATIHNETQRLLPLHTCRFGFAQHSDCSKVTVLKSNTRGANDIIDNGETYMYVQRSRRKRKGRHQISVEDSNLPDILTDQRGAEKPSICHFSDQMTYYSCLHVDEGSSEPSYKTLENKTTFVEIQDHHCCAVCLDLLYEPFKCSCDHVFCDPCLRQLNFRTSNRGSIRCPLCRQIVEQLTPATELRNEIRRTYDPQLLRKRDKVERRAAYRKWPLPANHGPLRRNMSRTRRSVTLPCIIYAFLIGASMYMLLLMALLSNLTANNVISMY